jgi:hypothetical protein
MSTVWIRTIGLATLLIGGGATAGWGQSVYPSSWDVSVPSAATAQTNGGLTIKTSTHYLRSATLSVTPGSQETILSIQGALDDTTILVRLLAATRQSGSTNLGSLREVIGWAIYDLEALPPDGQWTAITNHGSINNSLGGQIAIAFNVAGSGPLDVAITSPNTGGNSHNLLTVMIEAMANKAVTFVEHF